MMQKNNCWCQSGIPFKTCCSPFLSGAAKPLTPEQLMRSRYAAFCAKNIDYLMTTRHGSMRRPDEAALLLKTMNDTQWLGLRIVAAKKAENDLGYVEFVAFYTTGDNKTGTIGQLHENSRFVRDNGLWYYLDGQMLAPVLLRRNEPCFCGSRKKVKKCHGK